MVWKLARSFYLETRFVIISTSFSSRLVRSLTLLYRQEKNPEDLSSLQYFKYDVQYLQVEGEGKKWRTTGTIDFLLLNFVFVGTLKLNFLSLFVIFVSFFSKCDFIRLFIIIYSIYYMILKRLVKIILLILILEINNLRIQGISLYWITLIIVREGIQLT